MLYINYFRKKGIEENLMAAITKTLSESKNSDFAKFLASEMEGIPPGLLDEFKIKIHMMAYSAKKHGVLPDDFTTFQL